MSKCDLYVQVTLLLMLVVVVHGLATALRIKRTPRDTLASPLDRARRSTPDDLANSRSKNTVILPSLPELPDLPKLPNLPNLSDLPDLPDLSDLPYLFTRSKTVG